MAEEQPISERKPIHLQLPQSADAYGQESFRLILMRELSEQSDRFEPQLMRIGGGWMSGPVDVHVMSSDIDGVSIEVMLSFRFETQVARGCGTTATSTSHDLGAHLQIDRTTGAAILSI